MGQGYSRAREHLRMLLQDPIVLIPPIIWREPSNNPDKFRETVPKLQSYAFPPYIQPLIFFRKKQIKQK